MPSREDGGRKAASVATGRGAHRFEVEGGADPGTDRVVGSETADVASMQIRRLYGKDRCFRRKCQVGIWVVSIRNRSLIHQEKNGTSGGKCENAQRQANLSVIGETIVSRPHHQYVCLVANRC